MGREIYMSIKGFYRTWRLTRAFRKVPGVIIYGLGMSKKADVYAAVDQTRGHGHIGVRDANDNGHFSEYPRFLAIGRPEDYRAEQIQERCEQISETLTRYWKMLDNLKKQ